MAIKDEVGLAEVAGEAFTGAFHLFGGGTVATIIAILISNLISLSY